MHRMSKLTFCHSARPVSTHFLVETYLAMSHPNAASPCGICNNPRPQASRSECHRNQTPSAPLPNDQLPFDTILGSFACYFAEELNPLLNTGWFGNHWSLRRDVHRLEFGWLRTRWPEIRRLGRVAPGLLGFRGFRARLYLSLQDFEFDLEALQLSSDLSC